MFNGIEVSDITYDKMCTYLKRNCLLNYILLNIYVLNYY